ncbi:hypothetical protein O3G_MSEX004131 [Manduca sexta]|uniref:Uncharacterized protein n=1 Tax=Manduca sexta TaxID=7130 RepID=A0A921YUT7_MANSE|nr:hypothetical protein O3G_MSEX004131 [Manduca sexta]
MYLNIGKCFVITFTNRRSKIVNEYQIDGRVLARSRVAKDLGILFDDKLTFRAHYQHITSKANQLLGFVFRSAKGFKKSRSLLYLFNALARSILEYDSPVWSPHYKVHVNELERIQKKCLRMLCFREKLGRTNLNYETRLSKYNVQTLEIRRKYFDFLYLYKIIHSLMISYVYANVRH